MKEKKKIKETSDAVSVCRTKECCEWPISLSARSGRKRSGRNGKVSLCLTACVSIFAVSTSTRSSRDVRNLSATQAARSLSGSLVVRYATGSGAALSQMAALALSLFSRLAIS